MKVCLAELKDFFYSSGSKRYFYLENRMTSKMKQLKSRKVVENTNKSRKNILSDDLDEY